MNVRRFRLLPLLLLPLLWACDNTDPVEYVDPFIGTGGHGHTFPGATMPFGMVQLSPDTRLTGWDGCSGYHYSDSIVYGFSHTHLSGTGVSDYGDVLLMPFSTNGSFNNGADGTDGYRSVFDKSSEVATPGYYAVNLEKEDILVELTATDRVGFHRYTYKGSDYRRLVIDLAHRDEVIESRLVQVNEYEVRGYRHSKAWAQEQYLFFHIAFDQPITSLQLADEGDGVKGLLAFPRGQQLQAKVAISAVDAEGARINLEAEVPHWDFNEIKNKAKQAWNDQLSKIIIEDKDDVKKTIFYTALYHTMIAPNLYQDVDGRYRGTDLKIHQDTTYTHYTVFSLWDTYRSTHPLYTLIERERTSDFIRTFLSQYQQGNRLPMWELAANYTGCMIGYHAVPVIADAYIKGIRNYDLDLALEAMIHSAMQDRLGIDDYRARGYIPSDKEAESVSKTLEYAYDDWTIAEMAMSMGRADVASIYYERAKNYQNIFDPSSGFMRARQNNRWFYPFDPSEVNFNYTEANSWQYSYYVPQDFESWIDLVGGNEKAEEKLDALFNASSETTGREQADITGLIGQYAHGNEPSHHIPYLYNFVGRPDKTQRYVRQILDELYSENPDGLSGNEDCGQMSSWLVISALGFYPVTPGSSAYLLGSPWFEKATINLENGQEFIINAPGNSQDNRYARKTRLNGEVYPQTYLDHSAIINGGEISFEMSADPVTEYTPIENRPKSKIEGDFVAIPALETGDHAFLDSTLITITSATKGAQIYYSSSSGSSAVQSYETPFHIYETTDLVVWAEKNGIKSKRSPSSFNKIPTKRSINLETQYADHYSAGGDLGLIDFIRGGEDFRTGSWQGYQGVDLKATVDLGKIQPIKSVHIGFLQDENAWIFMPHSVSLMVSNDGDSFEEISNIENEIPYTQVGTIIKDYGIRKSINARYIRVVAKNRGTCPPDHKGAGGKAWIFADEIVIN